MYSRTQGRLWTGCGCVLLRRRSRLGLVTCFVACLAGVAGLVQLLSLACSYNEYILALLPQPALPLQTRPIDHKKAKAETDEVKRDFGPRILCLITTSPHYHLTRARHVAVTWSSHCTRAVFLTTAQDPMLPEVVLTPGAAAYDHLWNKVTQGFKWAHEVIGDFEWVLKADDDSFVLIENLKAAVEGLNPEQPTAAGVHLRTWDTDETYLNGGATYVLSRGAVRVLVEEGLVKSRCERELNLGTSEDVNMAACLVHLGVSLLDSRDSSGRQRFHIYPPRELVDPRSEKDLKHLWLKRISVYPYKFGYSELSEEVISFHYVDAESMYLIYYLVYLLNPRTDPPRHPSSPMLPATPRSTK